MGDKVTTRIEGLQALQRDLQSFPEKIAKRVTGRAVRKALAPVEAEAKARCPVETGASKDAIKVRPGKRRPGIQSAVVGASKKWFTGDNFYIAFNEFGHFMGRRKRRKFYPPHPFLRPAYDAKGQEAVEIATEELKAGIERELKKQ